ncbi:hypothetical protein H5P28_00300 [Ruficoccus amylovorans]|uniref:Uncharacterized protein n=1 Tax=Ruficoccus amylovorans TaxID=1804625 RepID=A0A842H8J0_9BACT|nr:hypothetical protein [Ruficoccus amylovorans]MBC2592692.1 hypothetical protein [Ruficoccus amylovorans]
MKVKVLARHGLAYSGTVYPKNSEFELPAGPVLDAALRFKQAEEVKASKEPAKK